jgi:hypothetical protein
VVHARVPTAPARTTVKTNRKVRDSTIVPPPLRPMGDPTIKGPGDTSRAPRELLNSGCQVACEKARQQVAQAEHWIVVGRVTYCRHCDFFTEEGEAYVRQHVQAYHGIPDPPSVGAPPKEEVEAVVDSHEMVGFKAEEIVATGLDPELQDKAQEKIAEAMKKPPAEAEGFVCDVCDRSFKSEKGLKIHRRRAKNH